MIRTALDDIATEVELLLRDAGLNFPVFLTVPYSGDALATIGCQHDPSDADWSQALALVCGINEKRLDGVRLRSRRLVCAIAN